MVLDLEALNPAGESQRNCSRVLMTGKRASRIRRLVALILPQVGLAFHEGGRG